MLAQTIHASAHSIPLPDKSVHAIITSPPYFGLRSYACEQTVEWPAVDYYPMTGLKEAGMPPLSIPAMTSPLGNEPTIEAFIGHLILCLREWWRILRDDGCCMVNLGDSYNSGSSGSLAGSTITGGQRNQAASNRNGRKAKFTGLRPKDLMMIPSRFALAAQADGWTLRSDIVWAKGVSFLADYAGSSMPESVDDRPSKSHEYIYLLTKGRRYFWDKEAVKEQSAALQHGQAASFARSNNKRSDVFMPGNPASHRPERENVEYTGSRSLRSVWVINPGSYPDAHFATYPEALVEPMIKATTSTRGCCPNCGAQYRRTVENKPAIAEDGKTCLKCGKNHGKPKGKTHDSQAGAQEAHKEQYFTNEVFVCVERTTVGWEPTCTCAAGDPVPSTILDPFVGSGTTLRVATALNRHSIGVDISAEYLTSLVPARLAGTQIGMAI